MKLKSTVKATVFLLLALTYGTGDAAMISTRSDRESVALTIYNANLGLVRDRRSIDLPKGVFELRFMDVASQIMPSSVQISAFGNPLQILEQNYEYDLLSPQKLLDKYVGKEVRLYQKNPHSERDETVTATLLSNNSMPVYKIGTDITFNHPGRVIFPDLPADLNAVPTLVWLLDGSDSGKRQIEASYLTTGISWKADYVLTLGGESSLADLAGWVTIDNRSGATYHDARIKLVAGDLNRVREEQPQFRVKTMAAEIAAAPHFKEEGLFEYHLYTLQRPSTIKNNQTKQISLLSAANIPVRRELVMKPDPVWYGAPQGGDGGIKQKIGVFVEFENRESSSLGVPLPKGIIRVYQQDADNSLQFVGEDSVDHTAKDETVRVKVGDAFDVTGFRRQTEWKKVANDTYEVSWELIVNNHKQEDVTIKVLEPLTGDWQVIESSAPAVKRDSQTAEFNLQAKKGEETKLTYRIRVRH